MKYTSILKWLGALWNVNSPEAAEVINEAVETVAENNYTYAKLVIHFKGGRSIDMRAWVDKGTDITEHALWKGMTEWLNDDEDNTPYFFSSGADSYHTCIVKSEVARLELIKEKDKS